MTIPRVDLALFAVVLLLGIIFGAVQVSSMPGVPSHGRYHPSDMDDLQAQLLGHAVLPKPYAAASDHPEGGGHGFYGTSVLYVASLRERVRPAPTPLAAETHERQRE